MTVKASRLSQASKRPGLKKLESFFCLPSFCRIFSRIFYLFFLNENFPEILTMIEYSQNNFD